MFNSAEISELSLLNPLQANEKVSLGLKALDLMTHGGIDSGDTAFILAKSGGGKSTFLDHIARHNALKFNESQSGKFVYLFLTEEDWRERSVRFFQAHFSLTYKEIKAQGKVSVPPMNLIVVDPLDYGRSILGITKFLESRQERAGLVIVDYLTELSSCAGKDHWAIELEGANMKDVALKMNVPFITGVQAVTNPEFNSELALLGEDNIAKCKALRNRASIFMSLNQTSFDKESLQGTVNVFKNRKGKLGDFKVHLDFERFKIGDLG